MNRASARVVQQDRCTGRNRLLAWLLGPGKDAPARLEPILQIRGSGTTTDSEVAVSIPRVAVIGSKLTSNRRRNVTPDPRLAEVSAEELARRLLTWLQTDFPDGATLAASDIMRRYGEMCLWHELQHRGWVAVARRFRALLGGGKRYGYVEGIRAVVYVIPPRAAELDTPPLRLAA